MSAYARFLEALTTNGFKYKADGRGRARAQCPGHNGDDLNLAVAIGDQGVLLRCHSYDCPPEDIAKSVGLTLNDLFDQDGRAKYVYPNGHEVIRTRTREGKKIVQYNHPGPVTELYQHPDSAPIQNSDEVVVVEGEKSVDAALRLGFPCVTTWPGGAANVDKVDVTPLMGKTVHLIADNDEPGRAAMGHLASMLQGVAKVATITTAPKDHQGVDDIWLDGGSVDDLIPFDPTNYVKGPVEDERQSVIDYFEGKQSSRMQWLWDGIVPLGAASVWAGMGGVSKSTFALWFAGRVTRGLAKGEYLDKPMTVLYAGHEDDPLKVTLPRLQVNHVDLARFATYGIKLKEVNGVMMPTFPEDIARLERAIIESGAKLVIIDPVLSTMEGDKNMNDARHVREVIDPLNQLAQRLNVAIICIAHVNKGTTQARTAVSGSGAWVDATRATVIFAMDEVEPGAEYQQVVIQGKKMNYTQTDSAYTYRVQGVDHMHDDGSIGSVPKIQWLGASTRSVDDILSAGEDRRNGWLAKEIKDFIDSANGVTTTKQILDEFKDQNPANVRQTLSRLVKSGKVHSPDRALYQSMKSAPQGPA